MWLPGCRTTIRGRPTICFEEAAIYRRVRAQAPTGALVTECHSVFGPISRLTSCRFSSRRRMRRKFGSWDTELPDLRDRMMASAVARWRSAGVHGRISGRSLGRRASIIASAAKRPFAGAAFRGAGRVLPTAPPSCRSTYPPTAWVRSQSAMPSSGPVAPDRPVMTRSTGGQFDRRDRCIYAGPSAGLLEANAITDGGQPRGGRSARRLGAGPGVVSDMQGTHVPPGKEHHDV
jgi:hypothetical protein